MKSVTNTPVWINFQRNLIGTPRCKNCESKCTILYDSHHDEYFSKECGLVVMEMGKWNLIFNSAEE